MWASERRRLGIVDRHAERASLTVAARIGGGASDDGRPFQKGRTRWRVAGDGLACNCRRWVSDRRRTLAGISLGQNVGGARERRDRHAGGDARAEKVVRARISQ